MNLEKRFSLDNLLTNKVSERNRKTMNFDEWYKNEYDTPGCGEDWAAKAAWKACKQEILNLILEEQKLSKQNNINLCMIDMSYLKGKVEKL